MGENYYYSNSEKNKFLPTLLAEVIEKLKKKKNWPISVKENIKLYWQKENVS